MAECKDAGIEPIETAALGAAKKRKADEKAAAAAKLASAIEKAKANVR